MTRYSAVITAIDSINKQDPRIEVLDGESLPKEYLYSLRMSQMLEAYDDGANELLKIAARGQHIKRWAIPREDYPMDRKGYLAWRTQLKLMHGSLLRDIMQKYNYESKDIDSVADMVIKKKLKTDKATSKLEDVACLVFLQYYFEDFAAQHPHDKILDILRKTWGKMSAKGKEMALKLDLSDNSKETISEALVETN
ncbi:DUF4202 domain-containing protein [Fulvivirga sp. 29W222]|uniref:DUF4202 domain-containing protein n=1 Tax=Fulvivirga marina TaxID=2494733 RepID=A0A937KEL6_9BACT|nr:DUF4202 domain-containing protein [Fulvivirga marina]MBL6449719.1 DUF4202 domain-containing protein [Fulvivirga marina]